MIWITAAVVGFLFFLATWLILQRSLLRILIGIMILGHGANLAILSSSGNPRDKLPPITGQSTHLADPLPQALLLTAIVIGFAVIAYVVALLYRIIQIHGKADIGEIFESD
ncbi:MAG: sodium:proton antiporter [Oceanipulchritudo sp.]